MFESVWSAFPFSPENGINLEETKENPEETKECVRQLMVLWTQWLGSLEENVATLMDRSQQDGQTLFSDQAGSDSTSILLRVLERGFKNLPSLLSKGFSMASKSNDMWVLNHLMAEGYRSTIHLITKHLQPWLSQQHTAHSPLLLQVVHLLLDGFFEFASDFAEQERRLMKHFVAETLFKRVRWDVLAEKILAEQHVFLGLPPVSRATLEDLSQLDAKELVVQLAEELLVLPTALTEPLEVFLDTSCSLLHGARLRLVQQVVLDVLMTFLTQFKSKVVIIADIHSLHPLDETSVSAGAGITASAAPSIGGSWVDAWAPWTDALKSMISREFHDQDAMVGLHRAGKLLQYTPIAMKLLQATGRLCFAMHDIRIKLHHHTISTRAVYLGGYHAVDTDASSIQVLLREIVQQNIPVAMELSDVMTEEYKSKGDLLAPVHNIHYHLQLSAAQFLFDLFTQSMIDSQIRGVLSTDTVWQSPAPAADSVYGGVFTDSCLPLTQLTQVRTQFLSKSSFWI